MANGRITDDCLRSGIDPYPGMGFGAQDHPPASPASPADRLRQRIEHDFTYHPPHGDQVGRFTAIRTKAREFALCLADVSPVSREQSLAITALEECVAWANAAIARENR